ncbi:MAG: hypothetical protein HOI32_08845 [Gammaproteobacteria bacterium]|nr:hypothetical protein [Gammaproteobacteria bacterium]
MTNEQSQVIPKRSWWNRTVPVRVRQNIRMIVGSVVALGLTGALLGSVQIRPIVFSQGEMLPTVTHNIVGTVDLFDHSVSHSIAIEIDDLAYDRMISDLQRLQEKTFVEVDMTIDGTFIPSVAVRLKGNSTLGGIRRGGAPPPDPDEVAPGDETPESDTPADAVADSDTPSLPGVELAELSDSDANTVATSESGDEATEADEPPPDPLMARLRSYMGGATEDDPVTLPLLISFDEYFPGRGYQGRTELSLRPVAGGGASLNEALSLQLIEDSGQVSQKYTWVSFTMNGSDTMSRLVLENPNQNYAASLGLGRGVLYKSQNGNESIYRGNDPVLYAEDILQLSAIGMRDISPVIRFQEWTDNSSDEEFDAELNDWLDVPSFARYVATQELTGNFDDMAGPGRNYLLWWDLEVEKFTVITWDMNLAMMGFGRVFYERISAARKDAFAARRGLLPVVETVETAETVETPAADEPVETTETITEPENTEEATTEIASAENGEDGEDGEDEEEYDGPPGRGLTIGHTLKDRFTASPAFEAELQRAREELFELWYESGHAVDLVNELREIVPITDRLTEEMIADQSAKLIETINNKSL